MKLISLLRHFKIAQQIIITERGGVRLFYKVFLTTLVVLLLGGLHETRVLHNSELFRIGDSGRLFDQPTRTINGPCLPVVILGDPAYPLRPWLMIPYINHCSLTASEQGFNRHLSHAQKLSMHLDT